MHAMGHMEGVRGQGQESLLSFHHAGPRDQTQVMRLCGSHLSPLRHLADSQTFLLADTHNNFTLWSLKFWVSLTSQMNCFYSFFVNSPPPKITWCKMYCSRSWLAEFHAMFPCAKTLAFSIHFRMDSSISLYSSKCEDAWKVNSTQMNVNPFWQVGNSPPTCVFGCSHPREWQL